MLRGNDATRPGIVHRLDRDTSGLILGGDGRPGIAGMGLDVLAAAPRFTRVAVHELGPDLWERYERA